MTTKQKSNYIARTYELYAHGKQGDDFAGYISDSASVSKSLSRWAADMEETASKIRRLASLVTGTDVEITCANTHTIQLYGPCEILDKAVENGLLDAVEMDEDEEEN